MYLNFKMIKSHREALSRLRCSSHMLQIKAGRHKNLLMADCAFSVKNYMLFVLEDEYLFLMLCPAYTDLRSKYTSCSSFIEILTKTENHKINKLASFVYHTEKLRRNNLTNMY